MVRRREWRRGGSGVDRVQYSERCRFDNERSELSRSELSRYELSRSELSRTELN